MYNGRSTGFQLDKGVMSNSFIVGARSIGAKETNVHIFELVKWTFFIFSVLIALQSCKKPEERKCFKGTGSAISESRDLGDFDAVMLYDLIDYNLIQDSLDKVVVHCGENLIGLVESRVENGTLIIEDKNRCKWLRSLPVKIKVDIHFSHLRTVHNESSGTLRSIGQIQEPFFMFQNHNTAGKNYLNIMSDELYLQLQSGSPLLEVTGQSAMTFFWNSGGGKLHAEGLTTYSAWVDNKEEGEIRVAMGGGPLWYIIDGFGDIYYRGATSNVIEESHLGSGELIYLD